jgi:hypothetical protein
VQPIEAIKNKYESSAKLFLKPLKINYSYMNWHILRKSAFFPHSLNALYDSHCFTQSLTDWSFMMKAQTADTFIM